MSFVGSTIGHIRIESRLGTGGMGEVYLGFDPRLERRVAVKTIRPEQRMSERLKGRFLREARLLSKLGHPSICQVYDLVETPEADFLVLEYVQGKTLRELASSEELSFERMLGLGEKIALALAAAHREKIVHRDLKADNVMVTPEGAVKVLDFGIARSLGEVDGVPASPADLSSLPGSRGGTEVLGATLWGGGPLFELDEAGTAPLTRHGMIVGTLHAMSPEQASGGEVTEASDLYSFGILLQELFTGASAYEATGALVAWHVVRAATRPITGLDPDLARLIQDLESFDPRRRPTAEEAAARLRWIAERPQRRRTQRLRLAAAATAFAVLVVLLAVVSWLAVEANRSRREADRRRKQAEGLISFMIGDLRPKLEAVNRLDLLDAVGDRALAYFDEIPEGELTREELTRRVDAILQIGAVRRAQGDLPAALTAFRHAEALGRKLAARYPESQRAQHRLVETYSWIGLVYFDQAKPEGALTAWREQLRIARTELARHPGEDAWVTSVGVAHHNIGTALEQKGDSAGALGAYRESLAMQRALAAKLPGDVELQAEIGATLSFLSRNLERQGDLAEALALRREFLAVQERLAARNPGDPGLRQDLASAQGFLASLLAIRGEREEARALFAKGLAAIADLAGRDPENAELQRWLAGFHSSLGALALAGGDAAAALPPLRTSRGILETLVKKDPTNADWQYVLAVCRSRTAEALELRDPTAARAEIRAALALFSSQLRGEPDASVRGAAARAEVTHGRIEAARGDLRAARDAWEQALGVLAPCPRPLTYWGTLAPWAEAQLALGHADEARDAVERLRAMGYVGYETAGKPPTAPAPGPRTRPATT